MSIFTTFCYKPFTTNITVKRFFSCMCSYMTLQVLLCRTFVRTQLTLKRLVVIVYLSVSFHISFYIECFLANVTLYWFFTCMGSEMISKLLSLSKLAWHSSHGKGRFSSLWLYICLFKESLRGKHASQTSHSNNFFECVL